MSSDEFFGGRYGAPPSLPFGHGASQTVDVIVFYATRISGNNSRYNDYYLDDGQVLPTTDLFWRSKSL